MRAGFSTIQQTLTPEAASVLNHSIAEAGRRNHGQTTPLHVAATLLASPSGFLRQACIKSHPNSSHPLQCRALELCFSVALERLPTAQNLSPGPEPPISNALMAALKRAQAHQRRGCPEQQQQPLLAVKVELEQLVISILDDPSVSRVMREASFSSPAVKATIEQSLNSTSTVASNSSSIGLGFRAPTPVTAVPGPTGRNLYLNPRLQQQSNASQSGYQRNEEVKRVLDIFLRTKKRNPVLVGESEPDALLKELLRRIENKEIGDGPLKNVRVIQLEKLIHVHKDHRLDKAQIPGKIKELGELVETQMSNLEDGGVILSLGDLKWLVEQPVNFGVTGLGPMPLQLQQQQQQVVSEAGRAAVAEMGKLLARFAECGAGMGRLWLIGTATCETYLRCQVYHPSMENDWDLQAVPIAARAPLAGMFPRLGSNGILGSSVDSFSPLKSLQTTSALTRRVPENLDPARRSSCCPQCMQSYEQELEKLGCEDFEKTSSEIKSEADRPALPQWLQNAKAQDDSARTFDQTPTKDEELIMKQKSLELRKKWDDTCLRLHPNFHHLSNANSQRIAPTFSMPSMYNPNLLVRQPLQPRVQHNRNLGESLQLNQSAVLSQPSEQAVSPPASPVKTDLVLGRPKVKETSPDKIQRGMTKDFLGCIPSDPQNRSHELQSNRLFSSSDADTFKKLLKGLMEKVWWQKEAASAVATTVTQCKLGNGKRRGAGSRGDTWLLFTGPDRVGKKKMASALSEMVYGSDPVIVNLGSRRDAGEPDVNFRGKTVLSRIVEAVKRNPFSVIMLEDIDEANMLVCGSIKRAMDRGRLSDSYGCEISLGNVIFVLTANWLPDDLKFLTSSISLYEKKLAMLSKGGWQLKLCLQVKTAKRRANWLCDEEMSNKLRKESAPALSFDLNEAAADTGDNKTDRSNNSSDLTTGHEDENVLLNCRLLSSTTSSASHELLSSVDDTIVFKPIDFGPIRRDIANSITKKFSTIIGSGLSIEIEDEALEKIAGGVWLSQTGMEDWMEKALVPSLHQLKSRMPTNVDELGAIVVRLEPDGNSDASGNGDLLPSSINVVVDGL
ncbi:Double Clp-N motif-containing P-loop nucleoside triphosphate hydrolases superfamily protein [Tripterygium wilfordii]|uniref:Double Clp-N motif-containing P-loop nucleoside triphosphate hydrolases superfamily protein n=1 Tax=Tripterygium wilfordii TaxID=458696 RepID=A0A7J7DT15_TRIWF|nr:protein SUPPRESSOR OF MAX2 1 [Tripterygium wilfordii]KAF5749457.1 Double Clp-N motif-containing P-loop nucleoside triphosphate hydrolases superfamily protein [Tripterygium wilfordii]